MHVKIEKDTDSASLAALFDIMCSDCPQRVQQRVSAHYAPNFLYRLHILLAPPLDSTLVFNFLPLFHDLSN